MTSSLYFGALFFCEERPHCNSNLFFQQSAHFQTICSAQQVTSFQIPTRILLFPENQRYKNKIIASSLIVRVDAALKFSFSLLLKLVLQKITISPPSVNCFSPDSMGFIQM
jgi:hypothetical protein